MIGFHRGKRMASTSEVDYFLDKLKQAVNEGRCSFVHRKKNLDDLSRLGISVKSAKAELTELTSTDYISGPEPDRNGSKGEIWIFGKDHDCGELYIKLKLKDNRLKVISFHRAEYRLQTSTDAGGDES